MLSQDEAIAKFVVADRIYKDATTERREMGAILADYARETNVEQNTVHLENSASQRVDVEFKAKVEYDPTLMRDVAQLLDSKFDEIFETVVTFKPKTRALKMFLSTKSTSEAVETAKKIIAEARIETPQTPYVKVVKE